MSAVKHTSPHSKLEQCQESKCQAQHKANEKFKKAVAKKIKKLMMEMFAGKLKQEDLKAEMHKIQTSAFKKKSNVDLIKCSINECNDLMKDLIEGHLKILKMLCDKGDKQSCKVSKIKIPEKLDFQTYVDIVDQVSKLA